MTTYPIRHRQWTRHEYDQLIKLGFFHENEPIELLGGQLIVAETKGTPHSTAIALNDVQVLRAGAPISPLSRPDLTVAVADLLP